MCWVDSGVKNHKEVVSACGRWGIRKARLSLENMTPNATPKRRAKIGMLAAVGVSGGKEMGGKMSQFRAAPHVMAARERMAVGRVKE